ncbi:MAG: hypothetical protein OHK005_12790 [Candidatus Methylacidiphilales bacterium]
MKALVHLSQQPGVMEAAWQEGRGTWISRGGRPPEETHPRDSIWKAATDCLPVLKLHDLEPRRVFWHLERGLLALSFSPQGTLGLLISPPVEETQVIEWFDSVSLQPKHLPAVP